MLPFEELLVTGKFMCPSVCLSIYVLRSPLTPFPPSGVILVGGACDLLVRCLHLVLGTG